jgi:hypothetical protein
MNAIFRWVLAVLGILALPLCIYFGPILWNFNRPPFPLSRLESLRPGMTTNEVKAILELPNDTYVLTNETAQPFVHWAYRRAGSWPIVYVHFHPDGTLDRHVYDY